MKAVVYHRYGSPDVLQLQETDKPSSGDSNGRWLGPMGRLM